MTSKSTSQESGKEAVDRRSNRRSAHRTVFDARQKLASVSGTRPSYDYELMRGYAASRYSTRFAMPLMLGILALFASLWVPPIITACWAALAIVTNTGVAYLRVYGVGKIDSGRTRRQFNNFTFGRKNINLVGEEICFYMFDKFKAMSAAPIVGSKGC